MKEVFEKYLHSLWQDHSDETEHSDRGALESLLNAAARAADPGICIIHEPKRVRGAGAPDFGHPLPQGERVSFSPCRSRYPGASGA